MPVPGSPRVIRYRGRARTVLTQIVRGSCPSDVDELGLTEELVAYVEESMAYAPPGLARALELGLYAVDAASVVDGGGTPLSRMSPEQARAYVEKSGHGANLARTAVVPQVRLLARLGYFEHPVVHARMGYDPAAWIEKVKKERLARHADDL
jgi:hypothetical protein